MRNYTLCFLLAGVCPVPVGANKDFIDENTPAAACTKQVCVASYEECCGSNPDMCKPQGSTEKLVSWQLLVLLQLSQHACWAAYIKHTSTQSSPHMLLVLEKLYLSTIHCSILCILQVTEASCPSPLAAHVVHSLSEQTFNNSSLAGYAAQIGSHLCRLLICRSLHDLLACCAAIGVLR